MAVTAADRDLLVTTLLETFGEDYNGYARLLAKLELRFPLITWRARLAVLAAAHAPFQASGLSIAWWVAEVGRLADAYKG